MKVDIYRLFFKAFSNRTRLDILALLRKSPKSVTEICNTLKLEQSRVSHNLKCLNQCGFVDIKKKGKERIYGLDDNIMLILDAVDKHITKYEARLDQCGMVKT